MKRAVSTVIILLVLVFTASADAIAAVPEISITINGVEVSAEIPPLVVAGQTMVPARTIGEAMGCSVIWDQRNRSVLVVKGTQVVKIDLKTGLATKNKKPLKSGVPAFMIDGRVLVPVRVIAQAFGGSVAWNATAKKVAISFHEARDGFEAGELLDAASNTLREATSYRFDGNLDMKVQITPDILGQGSIDSHVKTTGMVKEPLLYEKDVVTSSDDEAETMTSETYYNGTDYYQKIDNSEWEKLAIGLSPVRLSTELSQKPENVLEQFANVPMNAVFGDDVLIDGRKHYAVYVKFDQNRFKQYMLETMVTEIGNGLDEEEAATLRSMYSAMISSMRFDMVYKAYIDKDSRTISAFDTRSVFRMFNEGIGTSISSTDAGYDIYDMNKPLSIPTIKLP